MRRYLAPLAVLAALIALIVGLFIVAHVFFSEDEPGTPPPAPTVMVDGPDADRKRDDTLHLSPRAQDVREDAAQGEVPDLEGDLRGPDGSKAGVIDGPLAAQEWPGCKTAFVRAFSSRSSAGVRAIAYHYTAGGNVTGWGDLDGLTAYSNNLKNQVSWHFGVDREGHCTYNVPINQKAWTIAGLNSETINFEIVGKGNEPDWAGTAGLKTVARITWRIHRIEGIPIALGATDGNCHVTRPGIITHWMGGPCSGGHHDVRPYAIEGIIARVRALGAPPLRPCSGINIERALARRYPDLGIVVDGVLGSHSRAATRRFERANHLRVDGVVGPIDGRKLGLKGCRA